MSSVNNEVTEDPTEEPIMILDEYTQTTEVNPGLVASFKAEVLNDENTPRNATQWQIDLAIQSSRVYK